MIRLHSYILLFLFFLTAVVQAQDPVAENMLLYQRAIGGWPKAVKEQKVDYAKSLTESEKAELLKDRGRIDATIDNGATVKEIRYLIKASHKTGNRAYLEAAKKGIRYLLVMQHANGGWPQFFPDSSAYRSQVTFNDNAMVNVLNLLWDITHPGKEYETVSSVFAVPAQEAISKGIDCILKTQIRVGGKGTGWCAQYDKKTLAPAKARAFELPSISGSESVGIVAFLMKIEQPSEAVKTAINDAVQWFQSARIEGFAFVDIDDPKQPNGKDRVLVPEKNAVVWARFYDIETNKPFFTGRNSEKKASVAEIEHERRTGYAWYGNWPKDLLENKYPAWKKRNS